ncbi:hypothetical protein [Nostoc sp. CMAA1605]|nr:hypothetical protein [Nostoc sp. CMAA1605]
MTITLPTPHLAPAKRPATANSTHHSLLIKDYSLLHIAYSLVSFHTRS